jgi:hypothetical protein
VRLHAGDAGDADSEINVPRFFPFISSQILLAVHRVAADEGSEIPPARLTSSVVGHLLNHLGLQRHRTKQQRLWSLTPAELTRLGRAYGQSLPPELAEALDQAAALAQAAAPSPQAPNPPHPPEPSLPNRPP